MVYILILTRPLYTERSGQCVLHVALVEKDDPDYISSNKTRQNITDILGIVLNIYKYINEDLRWCLYDALLQFRTYLARPAHYHNLVRIKFPSALSHSRMYLVRPAHHHNLVHI